MRLDDHADRTEKLVGIRAEEIHRWIDGFFDREGFERMRVEGRTADFDPYGHRKFRHFREAMSECIETFKGTYPEEKVQAVFESHLRDDYNGYMPHREDFENEAFTEKYHDDEGYEQHESILNAQELAEYFQGKAASRKRPHTDRLSAVFRFGVITPAILAIALFIASIFFVTVPYFKKVMFERKKEMTRELTATAVSVVDHYIQLEEAGELTRQEAQRAAANAIRAMRYGNENSDYFWITDMHPRMVMHPYRPELDGQDLSDYRDIESEEGKRLFVEFVELAKGPGEGFVDYQWQWKDDPSRTAPKLSYIKAAPTWGWIVGTGIYLDDVEAEMARLTDDLLWTRGAISLLLIGILFFVVWESHRIETDRVRAEVGMREAKNRYRALVEASNEGYLLEIDGEIVYSSPGLRTMLGKDEETLCQMKVWDLLEPKTVEKDYLRALADQAVPPVDFEAHVATQDGKTMDVLVSPSRIFLSDKEGHVITFRPVTRSAVNIGSAFYGKSAEMVGQHFDTIRVGDICSPLDENQDTTGSISEDALVCEALAQLEGEGGTLLVIDHVGKAVGCLAHRDLAMLLAGHPTLILSEIQQSETEAQVIQGLNRLSLLVRAMTDEGARPDALRRTIGMVFDAAVDRFVSFALKEMGEPPAAFAFLSLGSSARHEMTLFTDQDNAIIFADTSDREKVQLYFLNLANHVCSVLNKSGYPYCPGGLMAVNPKYCLPLSEWKESFSMWMKNASPESIMGLNVFCDIRCVYGDETLTEALTEHIQADLAKPHSQFLQHFTRNCLLYKAPLDLFGKIRGEKRDGFLTVNIKDALRPIEIIARIYALKHAITESDTVARLTRLYEMEVLPERFYREILQVFDYLWRVRFYNQILLHVDLRQVNNELDLASLTDVERENLRSVLSRIPHFQEKLCSDFLGMPMYRSLESQ